MKPLIYLFILGTILCLAACNEAGKTATPNKLEAPKSIAELTAAIKGKNYKVVNMGLLSPFASDTANPVDWKVQQNDTSKFFRDYAAKQNQFTLHISADSAMRFFDAANNKTVTGTYKIDDAMEEGYDDKEKPGIKLRLRYSDSLDFGGKKTASVMTQSYLVKGLSANELVVETSQSFNRRTVVLWLKAE